MKCIDCRFYVDETDEGEYEHYYAVETKNGFCIMQDLFTMPDCEKERYCTEFIKEERIK